MDSKSLILFDLDNTLLVNDTERFVPAYMKKLAASLPQWPQDFVIQNLFAGTVEMVNNLNPGRTLEEVFEQNFYPALGIEKKAIQNQIDLFYDTVFPQLQSLTETIPSIPRIIEELIHFGHQLIIATKPLFPQKAILHRIKWAGLEKFIGKFSLITSYEDFHFSKPHLEFFAETFAQLGWPDMPAFMVGDSLEDDILPCRKIGIAAYTIDNDLFLGNEQNLAVPKHKMDKLPEIAGKIEPVKWEKTFRGIEGILAILRSTVAALDTLIRKYTSEQINLLTPEKEWNLTEIICHLRDADREVNIPRIQKIVRGENPFLPGVITDVWAKERSYRKENLSKAFVEFLETRISLIQILATLDPEDWEKPARHAIFGPTRLIELAGFVATHDRTHVQQAILLKESACK